MARTTNVATDSDRAHMGAALGLARCNLGRTWPNPSVGCVIVKDGRVVGRALYSRLAESADKGAIIRNKI